MVNYNIHEVEGNHQNPRQAHSYQFWPGSEIPVINEQ